MSLSPARSFSLLPIDPDASSNLASSVPNSTPPTTVADTASMHSDASKEEVITVTIHSLPTAPAEHADKTESQPAPTRGRRSCASAPIYNLAKLSGTAGHGNRRSKGDVVTGRSRRRRTIGSTIADKDTAGQEAPDHHTGNTMGAARDTIDALDLSRSLRTSASPRTRRQANESPKSLRSTARRSAPEVSSLSTRLSSIGKRIRRPTEKADPVLSREMRRLQDTKEFKHIDDKPVIYTVWANGKYVNPKESTESTARKKAKTETTHKEGGNKEDLEPITNTKQRRVKRYLEKGLYAGQDAPLDMAKGLTPAEKKKLAQFPELIPSGRVNKIMPAPMFTGLRKLIAGADFKLPYQICNPLPPGQPKPDEWRKMTKNRFIGESKDNWRKSPHFHDFQSKCVCKPDDGCAESCQNRIMLYECDENNCNVGRQHCTNRAFADLTARRNKGGKYRVGVEVIKTSDRGYGVRSNRCFEPHQIIMEYAGEIITEEECDRRMNEIYKDNECYYLMSFDQNMIIDATTGSIARFVNHSCNPNCRMIKWIVSGQPRMALFAGDKPIMTGDELTYDYNFDPFSAKNVQKCLCGAPNCRGVLGPKKHEAKPAIKNAIKDTVKAGKRKLQELLGGDNHDDGAKNKKRKIKPITSTKGALATVGMKVSKGAATALKKGMSTITASARKAVLGSQTPNKRKANTGAIVKKVTTTRVTKAYGKGAPKKQTSTTVAISKAKGKAATKAVSKKVLTKKSAAPKPTAKRTGVIKTTPAKTWTSPRKATKSSRGMDITVADPYAL